MAEFDILRDEHIKRAVCRAAAGKLDQADVELGEVEDRGGDRASVETARSYVDRRQRDEARARAAWNNAPAA